MIARKDYDEDEMRMGEPSTALQCSKQLTTLANLTKLGEEVVCIGIAWIQPK